MSQDDADAPSNVSANVYQWLAEIQSLQRQLAEVQRERDRAYASADNLRQLYDAEVRQRRRESDAYTRKIEQLQKALAEFQMPQADGLGASKADIRRIQDNRSVEQLQSQLVTAKQQCKHLKKLLKDEQSEHAQTRQSLTSALGDAVDLLAKERAAGS